MSSLNDATRLNPLEHSDPLSVLPSSSVSPSSLSLAVPSSSPAKLTTPWRSSVPLAYLSYNPPYFTLLPRSAPLLVSVQNVLQYGILPNTLTGTTVTTNNNTNSVVPILLYNQTIRIPLHIPIGPLYDLFIPSSSVTTTTVSSFPLSLTTLFDHTSGYSTSSSSTVSSTTTTTGSTSILHDAAQAAFYSSIKQSTCLIRNTLSTKNIQSQRTLAGSMNNSTSTNIILQGTSDLSKEVLETQWNAAKNGDSTCSNLQTIGIIPSLTTLTESVTLGHTGETVLSSVNSLSSSTFSYPIALRIVSVIPLPVSSLPLPGILSLPSTVTHTVMIGTYCSDSVFTLRQALYNIFIIDNPNNINQTVQYNDNDYEIILHGISTLNVPLLWETELASFIYPSSTGTLTNSLLHPDGFLYLALRKRSISS